MPSILKFGIRRQRYLVDPTSGMSCLVLRLMIPFLRSILLAAHSCFGKWSSIRTLSLIAD